MSFWFLEGFTLPLVLFCSSATCTPNPKNVAPSLALTNANTLIVSTIVHETFSLHPTGVFSVIGVGTVGAVGAAAPPIFGQGVQTVHYIIASLIF